MGLVLFTPARPARGGLLAFYTFEGTAEDVSGNGRHGTVVGAVPAEGFQGQGYSFNGGSSYISVPLDINPSTRPRLTMGAWINLAASGRIMAVVSQDNGGYDRNLNLDSRGGGGYRVSAFTGSGVLAAGPSPAPTGQWILAVARYDAVAHSLVLDVDEQRASATAAPGAGTPTLRIGSNPGFGEYFQGRIDNVFFYDEVLSDAQVNALRKGRAAAIWPACGPRLQVRREGELITLSWPDLSSSFNLYGCTSLLNRSWAVVPGPMTLSNGLRTMSLPATLEQQYFRVGQ